MGGGGMGGGPMGGGGMGGGPMGGGGMGGGGSAANPPCETLFVANLSPTTTEEELNEVCPTRPPPPLHWLVGGTTYSPFVLPSSARRRATLAPSSSSCNTTISTSSLAAQRLPKGSERHQRVDEVPVPKTNPLRLRLCHVYERCCTPVSDITAVPLAVWNPPHRFCAGG